MLYGIKDAASIILIPRLTNKPALYADYCNTSDISFTSETKFAQIKGVNSIRWDGNRQGTFKTEFEVFDLQWMALLFGTSFNIGSIPIMKREVLSVTGGSATITGTPKTGSLIIYKLDTTDNKTHLSEQTVGTPSTTADKYSLAGSTLTFNTTTSFPDNTGKVVCYYLQDSIATAQSFSVNIDNWPGNYKLYGDTTVRGQDGVDSLTQICLPNLKPKSNVTISLNSVDVTKLSIEWDVFPDPATGQMMQFVKNY